MTPSLQSAPPPSSPFSPLSPARPLTSGFPLAYSWWSHSADLHFPTVSLPLHLQSGGQVPRGCQRGLEASPRPARSPRRGMQLLGCGLPARSSQAPDFLSFAVISRHGVPFLGHPPPQDPRRPQDHVPANLEFQSICSQGSHLAQV